MSKKPSDRVYFTHQSYHSELNERVFQISKTWGSSSSPDPPLKEMLKGVLEDEIKGY